MSDINAEPDQLLKVNSFHVRCVVTDPLASTSVAVHLDVEHAETGATWRQSLSLNLDQFLELESLLVLTRREIGIEPLSTELMDEDPDGA